MSEVEAHLAELVEDFPLFGRTCLKIRNKSGKTVPLDINAVQLLIHDALQRQECETGWVRAIILKARQPGCSTYIAGRFYHKSSMLPGTNTYILAHEQGASNNLFGIVERFQRHNPIAPHIGTSNVKELEFDRIDSSYVVATAGQKAGGRGRSISLFHGSEVAFWPNAGDHFASSVQAVPLMPGTEIILESTANGPSGEFYERCQDAEAGRGDYVLIFVPWYLTPEYSRHVPPGFELSPEASEGQLSEVEVAETYGLTMEQMAWRRSKILELRSEELFRQEYPSDSSEAFVAAGHDSYISPVLVTRARHRNTQGAGPLVFGVDPASMGGDRFAVCARRGMRVEWVKYRTKVDPIAGAEWVKQLIDEHDPARVNVDAGNIGAATISILRNYGPKYVDKVRSINFGGTSQAKLAAPKKPGPANRRAEMWSRTLDWLRAPDGAALPDIPMLQSDLTAPKLKPKLNNDFLLESKAEMKARGVRSPDLADSLALTFALNEFIDKYSEGKARTTFGHLDTPKVAQPKVVRDENSSAYGWMSAWVTLIGATILSETLWHLTQTSV